MNPGNNSPKPPTISEIRGWDDRRNRRAQRAMQRRAKRQTKRAILRKRGKSGNAVPSRIDK